jgi:hypothetical protein
MQEILAKRIGPSCGAPPLTSPTSRGELSRRLPSDWEVQNNFRQEMGSLGIQEPPGGANKNLIADKYHID